jgi:predicted GNAT superfamily acetyltransferase
MDHQIRPLTGREASETSSALLALNNAHAEALSLLSPESFARLTAQAFLALCAGEADGLLIALDERADYDSPNFLWFRKRFDRFVYVDRVVVAPHARGSGLARRLYAALIAEASAAGHARIVAEVNVDPPNPASHAFHAFMGFGVVGAATLPSGKAVRYYAKPLAIG